MGMSLKQSQEWKERRLPMKDCGKHVDPQHLWLISILPLKHQLFKQGQLHLSSRLRRPRGEDI